MKTMNLFMLLCATFFYTHGQTVTVQNDPCETQQISKKEAQEIIKQTALSFVGQHLNESLKQAITRVHENRESYVELPATCFSPDTDPAVVEAFYQRRSALQNSLGLPNASQGNRFNLASRWSSTATDGGGLGQGDITTLTWSYVPDGTPIGNGGCGVPDQGTFSSDFISFFNGIYGGPTIPGDYTTAPWHTVFVDMFNAWSNVSGLVFVYEPNDDGSTVVINSGILGVRGDMRISGHRIDGNSGVLACNYYPGSGDMIIDTDDNFFNNNPGLGTSNVLAHEVGHGLGIQHVCPVNQTKLMEPFISFAFQGPQEDDILATNRHYGDPDGFNNTSGSATVLGSNSPPTSYSKVQRSIDDNSDTDYFSFSVAGSTTLSAVLTPTGSTYLNGVQNSNGSCSSGSTFNAQTVADLMIEILDTNGTTVLATGASNGPGAAENVSGVSIPSAGTYYVRIGQQGASVNNTQMYDLDINLTGGSTNAPPTAVCTNFTAQLDASGNVTIVGTNVDGGSSDPEGSVTLSVSPNTFTCTDVGNNTVTLTVTDNIGQTDTCTATVNVVDSVQPTAICQNITVQLNTAGNASITAAAIDNGSSDACGNVALSITPSTFDCGDVGANSVILTVTDAAGNTATCTSTVTVEDTFAPTATCQDITVQLDANGNASITAAQIDNGSTDSCGNVTLSASQTSFDCNDIGANPVTLTVTDGGGNTATCTSIVTVEDNTMPTVVCKDITIPIDASCIVSITAADIDNGSDDNCGVASLAITPSTFTCNDIGANTVTLTVTDVNGNVATCTATVTVDNILGVGDTTSDLSSLSFYPNPAKEVITISNPQSIALETIIIYDMTGRIVATHAINNIGTETTINISSLQSAHYMILLKGAGQQLTKRLIKE